MPLDRQTEVASVTGTGACEYARNASTPPGVYLFSITGAGVCHVVLSFHLAPDFVSDMKVTESAGSCCVQPVPEHRLIGVPELADASTRN